MVITWIRVQFARATGKVIARTIPVVSAIIPKLYVNPCDCLHNHIFHALQKQAGKPRRGAEQYSFC